MLKLGEWFDLQQTDIDTSLAHISSRQDALLQELREENDSLFSFTTGIGESTRESADMLRHRLKAWTRLCLHDQHQPQGILVTRHSLALELLEEVCEKISGQTPTALFSLDLPLADDDQGQIMTPLSNAFPALQEILLTLTEPLAAEQATNIADQWARERGAWQQLLDQHYPTEKTRRCQLEFHYFPGISVRGLLWEGFGGGTCKGEERQQGCCIAMLTHA